MIKSYLKLNQVEKENLYTFMNRDQNTIRDIEDIEKELISEIYDYGKGVLVYLQGTEVLGKVSVVLEVAEVLKTAYIHSVDILVENKDSKLILKKLIDESIKITERYKLDNLLLGIRNEKILEISRGLGLFASYSAYKMVLKNKEKQEEILELVTLTEKNIDNYVEIYNKSFMDMPHGTFIEKIDAQEFIKKQNDKNHYYFVAKDNNNIGFLIVTINDNYGEFDIGLIKEFRGKGYGKMLLETAIDLLKDKVHKIGLTVIEKNWVAFNMYKNRGFIIESKLSDWIKII